MRCGCRCPVIPWRADGGAILAGGTAGASVDRGAAAAFVGWHPEGWRARVFTGGTAGAVVHLGAVAVFVGVES